MRQFSETLSKSWNKYSITVSKYSILTVIISTSVFGEFERPLVAFQASDPHAIM